MPNGEFSISSRKRLEMIDITDQLQKIVADQGILEGVLYVFNPHTTAGILINEGADPDVQRDLLGALNRIVPSDYPYRHAEGNSPAHLMTALIGSSVTLFIHKGHLRLGTWQRIFFSEFDGPRSRRVWWKIVAG
ncbi:MAG: secondary thiamine-phosphate synthase enzyme YjbQ [Desulfobulbus sp.]